MEGGPNMAASMGLRAGGPDLIDAIAHWGEQLVVMYEQSPASVGRTQQV